MEELESRRESRWGTSDCRCWGHTCLPPPPSLSTHQLTRAQKGSLKYLVPGTCAGSPHNGPEYPLKLQP